MAASSEESWHISLANADLGLMLLLHQLCAVLNVPGDGSGLTSS